MMRLASPLFSAMVVACFTAALACLAARGVDRNTAQLEAERTGYLIVRVLTPDGDAALSTAASTLIADPRIDHAQVMDAARAQALLQAWVGPSVSARDLPPLRLIEVSLEPEAPAPAALQDDLARELQAAGVTAQVIGPPENGELDQARRIRDAAVVGALALSIVMALIVALAARTIAQRRKDYLEVMADLGGSPHDAGEHVSDEAGASGFAAGLLGATAAGMAGFSFLAAATGETTLQGLRALLEPADAVALFATPFVAALAAAIGGRWAAGAIYSHAARLR